MIISRTPYRISFFGGGTDYPAWYTKHGGAVLATTIDKYCYIFCRYLPPFFEKKYRIVYSRIESVMNIDEIEHPSVREVMRHMGMERGLEIHHDGDLPARSGVGSSSSFTVGLLNALYALLGKMPTKEQLTREAIHIEQNVLNETVGSQDQALAAYGGLNHITFHPNGELSVRPVTISNSRREELNSHLMLFFTGINRTAADVASSYVECLDERRRQLRIMKDMVEEGLTLLTGDHNITDFGELLHECWLAKRGLSHCVTSSEIDEIYESARQAGAVGGKLIGAGGGGFLLLFVPPEHRNRVRDTLGNLIHVPFKFESTGSQVIFADSEEEYREEELMRYALGKVEFKERRKAA